MSADRVTLVKKENRYEKKPEPSNNEFYNEIHYRRLENARNK